MSLLAVNRGQDPHIPAPTNPSTVDRSFVVRRLHKNAASLIAAHPRSEYLGHDEVVESLARSKGFEPVDLAILRIMVGRERHTLICVPERVWQGRKFDLVELKRLAAWTGRNCILVPEGAIHRQPRLSTARSIEEATGISVTMEQRMQVLLHLIEVGSSTLLDCASAVDHPSPFSAVLHMVALGVVKLSGKSALAPETRVDLLDPVADVA